MFRFHQPPEKSKGTSSALIHKKEVVNIALFMLFTVLSQTLP